MSEFETVVQTEIYSKLIEEIPLNYPNATNLMPSPFDPSGWSVDPDANITVIEQSNPSGASVVGEIEQVGTGTAVFSQSSSQSFLSGETVYLSVIAKQDSYDMDIGMYIQIDGSNVRAVVNVSTGDIKSLGAGLAVDFQPLSNGWSLVQVKYTLDSDVAVCYGNFRLRDESLGLPPVGSKVLMQAAFFGKANDWPANYYEGGELYNPIGDAIPVYDNVPQVSSAFPYVTIGEDIFTDMSTDTELINLVSITVHTWSRHSGRSETKAEYRV